jgi:hypothetical protein
MSLNLDQGKRLIKSQKIIFWTVFFLTCAYSLKRTAPVLFFIMEGHLSQPLGLGQSQYDYRLLVVCIWQYRPWTGSIKPSLQHFQFCRVGLSLGILISLYFFFACTWINLCTKSYSGMWHMKNRHSTKK